MGDRALLPLARLLLIKNLHQPPAERDWGPMAKMIDAAEKVLPDSVDVSILRAEMLVAQNRLAEAEVLLQNARRKAPKEVNLCRTQYALAERQLDWKKAEQFLEEIQEVGRRHRGRAAYRGVVGPAARRCESPRPFREIGGEYQALFQARPRPAVEHPDQRRASGE